ncbi:MAG: hypothetical protein NWE89_00910, partial [Candidatus Bathyarchaeota archaeon]|nr:hypothetical protein [Candidatus Bathyarchaeota archaeon]
MVSRDETCGALGYIIKAMRRCVDPNQEIEIEGDITSVGTILQHADNLHKKLLQEKEEMGGGGMVMLTQSAYVALMKKSEEADRISSAPMMAEASAGTGRPS